MSEKATSESLYIPVNIKTRYEFFDGFGMSELAVTAAAGGIGIVIALFAHSLTGNIAVSVLLVLISVAATGMAVVKDYNNRSVVDQVKCILRFSRTQQKYPYFYTPEWEDLK